MDKKNIFVFYLLIIIPSSIILQSSVNYSELGSPNGKSQASVNGISDLKNNQANNGNKINSMPARTIHDPILIVNNSDLISQANINGWNEGGTSDGSSAHPYVIKNLEINYTINGINITNVNLFLTLDNILIKASSFGNKGLNLQNTNNTIITNSVISFNFMGMYFSNVNNCNLTNDNSYYNNYGAIFLFSSNNYITNGNFSLNSYFGLQFNYGNKNVLKNNVLLNNGGSGGGGLYISGMNNNTISNNMFNFNNLMAIGTDNTKFNVIDSNKIYNNVDGLHIFSVSNNNIIKNNIAINNTNAAFDFSQASFNNLSNNTALSSQNGFMFYQSSKNVIDNNFAMMNINTAFAMINSDHNSLNTNNATQNGLNFVIGSGSYANIMQNNYARNANYGYYINSGSYNNSLLNNIAILNQQNGFQEELSYNNNYISNIASLNLLDGISIFDSSNTSLMSNDGKYNGRYGFLLSSVDNATLSNNIANNNIDSGFSVQSSYNSSLSYNSATNNTVAGFDIIGSSRLFISNNVAFNNGLTGFVFDTNYNLSFNKNFAYGHSKYDYSLTNFDNSVINATSANPKIYLDNSSNSTLFLLKNAVSFILWATNFSFVETYSLFDNGSKYLDGILVPGSSGILLTFEKFSTGHHDITIYLTDNLGNVTLDVLHLEIINPIVNGISNPVDQSFTEGTGNKSITWTILGTQFSHYEITVNNIDIKTGSINSNTITYPVSYLPIGVFEVNLIVFDNLGNSVNDSVVVVVSSPVQSISITTVITTIQETTTSNITITITDSAVSQSSSTAPNSSPGLTLFTLLMCLPILYMLKRKRNFK